MCNSASRFDVIKHLQVTGDVTLDFTTCSGASISVGNSFSCVSSTKQDIKFIVFLVSPGHRSLSDVFNKWPDTLKIFRTVYVEMFGKNNASEVNGCHL